MASRRLSDLRPEFRRKAELWLADCADAGLDILVYCTLRDHEEQAGLYAQGRTKPGRIVTYAKPGESAHNHGLALDFVPLVNGKPDWRAGTLEYVKAVDLAEQRGMESASKWKRFKEWPHLQEPNWRAFV